MNKLILEEIQRMKLLSKYDNSKTLSEQVKTPEQDIAQQIYKLTTIHPTGTNEKGLVDTIKQIKSVAQLKQVDDALAAISRIGGISATINDELGNGDVPIVRDIENHLKSIGASVKSGLSPTAKEGNFSGGFNISYGATDGAAQTNFLKQNEKPGIGVNISERQKIINDTFCTVKNGIISNPNSKLNGKPWKNYTMAYQVSQTEQDVAKRYCDSLRKPKVNNVVIPTQLKDANGVRAFQDWLDVNAKGWATGYKDGIINKGQNGSGYGKFGLRTQKAWNTYGKKYLTPVQPTAEVEPTTTKGTFDPNKIQVEPNAQNVTKDTLGAPGTQTTITGAPNQYMYSNTPEQQTVPAQQTQPTTNKKPGFFKRTLNNLRKK